MLAWTMGKLRTYIKQIGTDKFADLAHRHTNIHKLHNIMHTTTETRFVTDIDLRYMYFSTSKVCFVSTGTYACIHRVTIVFIYLFV